MVRAVNPAPCWAWESLSDVFSADYDALSGVNSVQVGSGQWHQDLVLKGEASVGQARMEAGGTCSLR